MLNGNGVGTEDEGVVQTFVLDAGAIIAQLASEPGGDFVRRILERGMNGAGTATFVHVLNLCEVFYDISRKSDSATAKNTLAALEKDGLQTRADLDTEFWQDAAQIKAVWKRISLADCFGVALARRLDATFLTTDRHELETLADAKVARIEFIR